MTTKRLFLLRHAKSDWSQPLADHQRPLNRRGQQQSRAMGTWLQTRGFRPECIVSSDSVRTRETLFNICDATGFKPEDICWEAELYHASAARLLAECRKFLQQRNSVLLVAHNPGLDDLLSHLCHEDELTYSDTGKLMTTAAFAEIELPDTGEAMVAKSGRLITLQRPADLDNCQYVLA